jgi:hypothetical protein
LFVQVAVPAIVVAFEICWSCLAAQVAVNALVVHEKLSIHVVAVFVCCVCHIDLISAAKSLHARRIATVF